MSAYAKSLLVIAILTSTVSASPAATQGFGLGGGANLSDFIGDDVGENDRKTGLDLGLSVPLPGIGPLHFRAEGYYRQKGARRVSDFQQAALAGEDVEFGIDYVEVPVIARLGLPSLGRRVFPYLEGGPAFAWRIDCGLTVPSSGSPGSTNCDQLQGDNLEETIRDYEQGLVLGGGLDVPVLSVGSINVDARYTRGLSRLVEEGEIRNRALSVMLGYSFGLPRGFRDQGGGMLSRTESR